MSSSSGHTGLLANNYPHTAQVILSPWETVSFRSFKNSPPYIQKVFGLLQMPLT